MSQHLEWSPALHEAKTLAPLYGVENNGLPNLGTVYWNLPAAALYEEALVRREGRLAEGGALVVTTGKHTARSANDKFIVWEPSSDERIWWGEYNRPFSSERFSALLARLAAHLQREDVFVQDCYVGSDPEYRLATRVVTQYAWHSLFARSMFNPPTDAEERRLFVPEFTLIAAPDFQASPEIDGTASKTFIVLDFDLRIGIIGGTGYAGEIKKSMFTVLNYLLPLRRVMAMHCSANVGPAGDVALFFGLSGTGKTSLSADPERRLIGDDEAGWSDDGVFNYEGGCYAKVIRLSPTAEPQIWDATRRFGCILENVVLDPLNRRVDLNDDRLTENTRASYPLDFIANAVPEKRAGHPKNIVMLTCDAYGVMPPIARMTPDQALYHFVSGYTAKVAGTEMGMRKDPEITFSTCFGGPFMVHHPGVYADLLKAKILKHGAKCWLINTGWTGGPYGTGKRISIAWTRRMLNAALAGELDDVPYRRDEVFGFEVPTRCPDVPDAVFDPESSWPSRDAYRQRYRQLASSFVENFRKFQAGCSPEVLAAGPRL